ncbi:hypothetical protein DRB89_34220 [Streptomyces sp. ICC4]|nr:hypothetical protein DRB89_34220 [Streptomyces sp. ICC4]
MEEIGELLAWGWDAITGPALEALGHRAPPKEGLPWPRVQWCATGPLSTFPLFATGHHDGSGRAVIDRVVSSEAPTLRILAESARPAVPNGRAAALLAVSVPTPFDRTDVLRGVREEIAAVTEAAPVTVTTLAGSEATRGSLLSGLGTYAWFHFAGHGARGLTAPTDTALSAFDGPVTLADLAALRIGGGGLAYLSACHGADAHDRHPAEALHLAAAVHLAGFRHVIAARHELDDRVATRTATAGSQQFPPKKQR